MFVHHSEPPRPGVELKKQRISNTEHRTPNVEGERPGLLLLVIRIEYTALVRDKEGRMGHLNTSDEGAIVYPPDFKGNTN